MRFPEESEIIFAEVYKDAFARIAEEEHAESDEPIDFAAFGDSNSDWPTVPADSAAAANDLRP